MSEASPHVWGCIMNSATLEEAESMSNLLVGSFRATYPFLLMNFQVVLGNEYLINHEGTQEEKEEGILFIFCSSRDGTFVPGISLILTFE